MDGKYNNKTSPNDAIESEAAWFQLRRLIESHLLWLSYGQQSR
jgi:hypothetical protein